MTPLYINGRILLRDQGGVRRYATEISNGLDTAQIKTPRSAAHPWSGRLWEQTTLLRSTADGVLLNMAHSGPVRHSRQVNVVHDVLALTDPRGVHPAYAALLRRQLPRHITAATRLVTVSAHVADQISGLFDVPRDTIDIVPPGIATVFTPLNRAVARQRLNLDTERPVVAALLDPTPRKNSTAVATMLHELHHEQPHLQIVVAGNPHLASFAKGRRGEPPSREGFVDLGAASDIELATMYQAANIFVSLSSAEGFGLPVVEAMACGAAVVTTPTPSITEHARGCAQIIANPREAKLAVQGLLTDTLRQAELASAGQEALGDLQWGSSAASLGVIMRQVGSP